MKKVLFNCLMITSVICACFSFFSCNYFNEPIAAYFEKYTSTAAIESHTLSVTTMLDAAGNPCIGSSQDLVITFALRNPQSYTLLLTPELGSLTKDDLARSCVQENKNTVRLTVTASALFELEKNNSGTKPIDISPLIQIRESETLRAFDSYTFPLALNTPPPQVTGAVVCVDKNSEPQTYVVCFTMPSADILKSVHTDITKCIINNQEIALTVNADGTYAFGNSNGNLIPDATNLVYATNIDVSFTPAGTNQLYYKTGIGKSDSETTFSLKLRDTSGLTSEVVVSSKSEKLGTPTATATIDNTANTSVSNIQGTPSAVNQNQNDAYGKVTLTVPNKTTNNNPYDKSGATITYAVYTVGSPATLYATGKSTGNSITLSLPPTGSYKIEATANKSLYVESDSATFYATVNFNDLYVSASGDNDSGHGTKAKPFKTIAHAIGKFSDYTSEKRIHLLSNIKENVEIETADTINLQIIGTDTNNNAVMRTVTSGADDNSVFNMEKTSGSDVTFNVTLKNLIITGGKKTSGNGGGVCIINGAAVTLDHVTVTKNLAYNGGGVAVVGNSSSLTLKNGTVIGNKNATSEPKDVDSALNNGGNVVTNKTDKTKSCAGGGIFAIGTSSITIKEGCYVSGNIAYSEDNHDFGKGELGGGIFINETATLTIGETSNNNEQVYIQYNSVGLGRGGGIAYCSDKDAGSIKNTIIRGNKANIGGGVYVNKNKALLTLEKCTIHNNSVGYGAVDGLGGGIYIRGLDANVCLIECKITENTTGLTGPGIWIMGKIGGTEEKSNLHLSGNLQIEDAIYFNSNACSPIQIDGAFTNTTKIPLYGAKVEEEGQLNTTIIEGSGSHTLTPEDCDKFKIKDKPNLMICWNGVNSGVLTNMSTTFYVDSNATTEGDGTLEKPFRTIQDAVNKVINDNNGTSAYTIYLTGTFTDDPSEDREDNGKAFVNIAADKKLNLTITGYNDDTTATINANRSESSTNKARVMNITMSDTSESASSITLQNLILKGGYVEGNGGGILSNKLTNLTLNNVTVGDSESTVIATESNCSNYATQEGGGIYSVNFALTNTKITLINSKINHNYARFKSGDGGSLGGGAGIRATDEISIDAQSSVSYNGTSYSGGGIFLGSGKLTLNGTISNNKALNGGGVYIVGGESNISKFTLSGGTISNNTATKNGGGVYADSNSAFTMSSGIIGGKDSGNEATIGGGVFLVTGSIFKMSGASSTISYNSASKKGAGVYVKTSKFENGTPDEMGFTMKNGTISHNIADTSDSTASGGGVYIDSMGTFTMKGGSITENTAPRAAGVDIGDGTPKGTFTMEDGNISNNHATGTDAGGVYVSGPFTMKGGTISGNTAITNGAGVHVGGSTFTMTGGTISGNKPGADAESDFKGGGVYIAYDGTFEMKPANGGTCTAQIAGNKATFGAGVYIDKKNDSELGTFNMSGGTIGGTSEDDSNIATGNGGGVYSSGTFEMTGGKINYNKAVNGSGVAVVSGTFTMNETSSNAEINNNYDSDMGGGVIVSGGSEFTMYSGTIKENQTNYGGGVLITGSAFFEMKGGTIDSNKATGGNDAGGGVHVKQGTFTMSGGSITNNETTAANSVGGGVYVTSGSTFTVSNDDGPSTILSNKSQRACNNVYLPNNTYITINKKMAFEFDEKIQIGVSTEATNGTVTITSGYGGMSDPDTYFLSDFEKSVELQGNEAAIKYPD